MEFVIKPRFNALRNSLYFTVGELNALQTAEYADKFGFYQRTFGVYSMMELTRKGKYRIHYPEGTPFMWQPHNSCAWTPTGTLSMSTKDIEACRVKINEQYCYDEFFDSTYSEFLEWSRNPTIGLSTAGQQASDALARTIVKNATLGARMTLTGGQLHDLTEQEFVPGTETRIQDAFRRTNSACRGWIALARTLATENGNEHLETGALGDETTNEISADGRTFNGSVVDLHDSLYDSAPIELQDAIAEGGVGGFGNVFYPIMPVSPSMVRAIRREFNEQKTTAQVNEPRITRTGYPMTTEAGTRTVYVYMIDDTVIIPIPEVAQYDKYLNGTSHFAYLTLSGVIQLGTSFGELPVVNESEVGVLMQVSDDAEDYGTHKFLAHALLATAINDTNYIAGDYIFAESAA